MANSGHGGFDGGAVADDGTVEKDINLYISQKLKSMLSVYGFEIVMTRTEDIGTDNTDSTVIAERKKSDLQNRIKIMKEYPNAIFVSIHLNKFTTSAARGAQVFYSTANPSSKTLAQTIQASISKQLQPENTRVIKPGNDNVYILKKAEIPAVIVECGFLSNTAELELLKNEEYQAKLAFSVMSGILDYYCKDEK